MSNNSKADSGYKVARSNNAKGIITTKGGARNKAASQKDQKCLIEQ